MKNLKRYIFIYDYFVLVCSIVYFCFYGVTDDIQLLETDIPDLSLYLIMIAGTIPVVLILLHFLIQIFEVDEKGLKTGFIIKRKVFWKKITKIEFEKKITIYHVNKKGKEKKYVIRIIRLKNNYEKYIQLIKDIVENVHAFGNVIIEESPIEIIGRIYKTQTYNLVSNDGKPLKIRGFLLLWYINLIYAFVSSVIELFNIWINVGMYSHAEIMEYNLMFNELFIFQIISVVFLVIMLVMFYSRKKKAIKFIIGCYWAEAIKSIIGVAYIVNKFAPWYEPTLLTCILYIFPTVIVQFCFVLLIRRYFTTSIRVKNTFVK